MLASAFQGHPRSTRASASSRAVQQSLRLSSSQHLSSHQTLSQPARLSCRRPIRASAASASSSWNKEMQEAEIRRKMSRLEEERDFAQKEAVEAIAELKAATAAVEASWSMASNAVKADDEAAARLLLENKAKKKEAMEKALQKAETKQALEKKLGELIKALEMELIQLRTSDMPAPAPPPPKPKYVSEEDLSDRFLELERGDLEAQLKRELRARDIRPPGSDYR